ncbi:MAG: MarR family transcriptional regulator [Fimbriimonadaceae bacterium]|nr:MarR family transcriptional regulator [Chthonomonadaceae bacterium]MCO5298123.1 MarR family transcriptional regulator [Fimbriimonadaceae bacterium]
MEFVEEMAALLPDAIALCRSAGLGASPRGIQVSAARRALLELLDPEQGASVGELARRAGVTAATMSTALNRLERDGCAVRERSQSDARVVEVRLTPEGEALRHATSPIDPQRLTALAEHLTYLEQREVLQGLRLLCQAAAKSTP